MAEVAGPLRPEEMPEGAGEGAPAAAEVAARDTAAEVAAAGIEAQPPPPEVAAEAEAKLHF